MPNRQIQNLRKHRITILRPSLHTQCVLWVWWVKLFCFPSFVEFKMFFLLNPLKIQREKKFHSENVSPFLLISFKCFSHADQPSSYLQGPNPFSLAHNGSGSSWLEWSPSHSPENYNHSFSFWWNLISAICNFSVHTSMSNSFIVQFLH